MTKRIITMGLLLALAGCVGTDPQAQPSAESIQPRLTQASPEQDPAPDIQRATVQTPPVVEEIPKPEDPAPSISMIAEPGEPNVPEPPEKIDITELIRYEEPPTAEPNLAAPGTPRPSEPNETPATESEPPPVEKDEPGALAAFYEGYAEVLEQYVRPDGLVDYSPLRRKRLRLKQLLAEPDELDPNVYETWSRNDKLAFWINTYNVKMLDVIARNYPIQSSMWLRLTWTPSDIRHIKGIWSDYRFIVMDEEFTLGEVERRIFRETFAEPRVYLAVTYASRSSPALRRTPYRGQGLDQQLDEQVKAFLADDKVFRIDRLQGVVYLSALFKPSWRGKEFVGPYGMEKKFKSHRPETRAVLNFLTRYVSAEDVYFLEVENYTLKYLNFDWRLNDTSKGY